MMLYTEVKWSRDGGRSSHRKPKSKKIGVTGRYTKSSQGQLTEWKIKHDGDYTPRQYFLIQSYDKLCNLTECSPYQNVTKHIKAWERHPFRRYWVAVRYLQRMGLK